ncbi:MAG: sensory protein TspO [Cytophagaceae bacterium]|nr:sensory protein TspO [Cytophagaceae bacterium]|tara:strand:+ start:11111 stop:11587 length:477 start_codon:yes stop_codon:yes gene_type:complete
MGKKLAFRILASVGFCLILGFFAHISYQMSIDTWFAELNKPAYTPGHDFFVYTWLIIFIIMGIAAGIVWNKGFYHKWVKTALYHFGFQLIINASFFLLTFGARSIFLGLMCCLGLFILLIFTFKWFRIVEKVAAYLLIPYILWIAFISIILFQILMVN